MKPIYEKYRPARLSQIVGQDKAVGIVRRMAARQSVSGAAGGLGGQAFFISGKSGTGKTTLARIIAASVADEFFIEEHNAEDFTKDDLNRIVKAQRLCAWGKGGRAVIINEAHRLRANIVTSLLTALEPISPRMTWVFTTTIDGLGLFEDEKLDAGPLLSRCTPLALTSQGVAPKFARLLQGIARREHCDGEALSWYLNKVNGASGNMRAALQELQTRIGQ
jgi:replication-associated recombination protein RarA